jgi:23S rRNA (adenine2030-N6)-methyltransferase
MLSYQHGYHAGNFADVVKHVALTRLCDYLTRKDKPLYYLETHSGRGHYDLHDQQALKTGEAKQGIELLWNQRQHLPEVFSLYMDILSQLNSNKALRYYPGSPALAIQLLRPQDRLFLCELHPKEFDYLQTLPHDGKRVFCSKTDGLQHLRALPPPEKRGLIFIDPSYEIKTDYREIPALIKTAYSRFTTGVYCLWYPLVDKKLHEQLLRGLTDIGASNCLRAEFYMGKGEGMVGCGLWVINPPYVFGSELKSAFNALLTLFNPGISSYLIE